MPIQAANCANIQIKDFAVADARRTQRGKVMAKYSMFASQKDESRNLMRLKLTSDYVMYRHIVDGNKETRGIATEKIRKHMSG